MSRQLDEERVFHVARGIADPQIRQEYIEQICGPDRAFRERVEAMLRVHQEDEDFLKSASPLQETGEYAPTVVIERPGASVGRFKLMEQIGEGGMGVVFVAQQERPIQRKVALKVVKPGMDSETIIARFEAERQALAMMDHPNIAKVLDAGTSSSGRPYFAMELVKGVPITEYCDRNKLGLRRRLTLFSQVCHAIQHAHQKGIIHRDIKPNNVLVTLHDGQPVPKVIDFGVAKALNTRLTDRTIYTAHFQVVGTLLYMSPEQAELSGLDIDTRSDVYALGVLLYELLTGTTPFRKEDLESAGFDEQRRMIREEDPPLASDRVSSSGNTATAIADVRGTAPHKLHQQIRGELDWILLRALEKDRTRRYDGAVSLAADIDRYLNDEAVAACPPSFGYRFRKFATRNWAAIGTLVVVFLALTVGATVAAWQAAIALHAQQELARAVDKMSTLLFRDALLAAMGGNRTKADEIIRQAEQGDIQLRPSWIDVLKGQRSLYAGETQLAYQYLEKAARAEPDGIMSQAMLSVAYALGGHPTDDGKAYEELTRRVTANGKNASDLDMLFFAHAQLYVSTQPSIQTLRSIKEQSPLRSAILADALAHYASESGELQIVYKHARKHVASAREYLPGNAYVLMIDLWVHVAALELMPTSDPRRAELVRDGEEVYETLTSFPDYEIAQVLRVLFLQRAGRPKEALKLAESLSGGVGFVQAYTNALRCEVQGFRHATMLAASDQIDDPQALMSRAIASALNPDADRGIRDAYRKLRNRRPGYAKIWQPEDLLLLQSDRGFRIEQCESLPKRKLTQWERTCINFIGEKGVAPQDLEDAADVSETHRRAHKSRAFYLIGMMHRANGDIPLAIKYFERCKALNRAADDTWASAFLRRLSQVSQH